MDTARTAAHFSRAPFIGAVLAVALLGEPVTTSLLVAAALMAVGLFLHFAEPDEHLHNHAPLTHEHRHGHDAHHRHRHGAEDPPGDPHGWRIATRTIPTCITGTGIEGAGTWADRSCGL